VLVAGIKSIENATPTPPSIVLDYWSGLHDYLVKNEKMIRPPKALLKQWMTFGVGRADFT
jgi:hypothetical protein